MLHVTLMQLNLVSEMLHITCRLNYVVHDTRETKDI